MAFLTNRVLSIHNKRTSMRLTMAEWRALETICTHENIPRKRLLELISLNKNPQISLTSSVRLFATAYYKSFIQSNQSLASSKQEVFTNSIFEAIKEIS